MLNKLRRMCFVGKSPAGRTTRAGHKGFFHHPRYLPGASNRPTPPSEKRLLSSDLPTVDPKAVTLGSCSPRKSSRHSKHREVVGPEVLEAAYFAASQPRATPRPDTTTGRVLIIVARATICNWRTRRAPCHRLHFSWQEVGTSFPHMFFWRSLCRSVPLASRFPVEPASSECAGARLARANPKGIPRPDVSPKRVRCATRSSQRLLRAHLVGSLRKFAPRGAK